MTEPDKDPAVRRLLVLSASGGFSAGLSGPDARPWPEIVHSRLQERLGDVELVLRRFYVHAGNPLQILESELAHRPDFIVLQCTSFPATLKTVANRVEALFGRRAGDWTEARIRTFDEKTRSRSKVSGRLNGVAHRAGQRVLGTASMMGVQPLVARYKRAIDRIAVVEAASIAVFGTGFASALSRENNPEVQTIKQVFNSSIAGYVNRKHLGWVDSAAITTSGANPEEIFVDMLHRTQEWHTELGERLADALLGSYQSSQS